MAMCPWGAKKSLHIESHWTRNQEDILYFSDVCPAPVAGPPCAQATVFAPSGRCSLVAGPWPGTLKGQHLPLLLLCGSLAGRQGQVWAGSQSQEHVHAHRPGALALRNGAVFFSSGRTISSGGPYVGMGSGEGGVEAGGRKGSRGACC